MAALNKTSRNRCWKARDTYWQCLDENEVHADHKEKCKHLRPAMVESCPKSWVTYFDRRKDYLKFKENTEKNPNYRPSDKQ